MKINFKVIIIISFLTLNFSFSQNCTIQMKHFTFEDSLINSSISNNICLMYKTKGRNKLNVYSGKFLVDSHKILKIIKKEQFIELLITHSQGAELLFRFYKNENKLVTITSSNYYISEEGTGLSYQIFGKLKK